MAKKNILITGGAGFIGSNLAERLLSDDRIGKVRVLDNLATGFKKNITPFLEHAQFEFIEGDIRDFESCLKACEGMDLISHQAALGSVPRSIKDPLTTNEINISGTLNVFQAGIQSGVKRVVFAASSSTYGDSENLPKVEHIIGSPLSPYAVTKYVMELYADVFSKTYDFEYVGLRYFNVFGPRQDPKGAYAAVIPIFLNSILSQKPATINGDGTFSRDFTYIENVIQANLLSLFTDKPSAINQIYNIAFGQRTSLNQLWDTISELTDIDISPIHGPERVGDIPHSHADISKAKSQLGYDPTYALRDGLKNTIDWFKKSGLLKDVVAH